QEQVELELKELGFKHRGNAWNPRAAADMNNPTTTYGSSWRLKMQLACAKLLQTKLIILEHSSIFTHLDVRNIALIKAWLRNFVNNLEGGADGTVLVFNCADEVFVADTCTGNILELHREKVTAY
ncbi:unnamed protein product, partial [Amoebophrya sp. A25]